ncbi:MAG: hypothetical protein AAF988_08515 [Pseudomonadota bacterium]
MRLFLLLFSALTISGCVQHTKMLKPLAEKQQGTLNIQSVTVSYSDLSAETIMAIDEKIKTEAEKKGNSDSIASQPLKSSMAKVTKEVLEARDSDTNDFANIYIEVDNLKFVDPMAAILISDTDQLSGSVKVVDPKTKELLSEFYVDVLKGTGGLLGLAVRGGGVREKLSAQFAEYIGDNLGFEKIENTATYNSASKE